MKIILANLWSGRRFDNLITFLDKEKPDVLLAQEVYSLPDKKLEPIINRERVHNLHEQLSKLFKYNFFGAAFDRMDKDLPEGAKLYFGNAIYSNYEFLNKKVHFYDVPYTEDFHLQKEKGIDSDYQPRNFQIAEIKFYSKKLALGNTHGIWQKGGKKTDTKRTLEMVNSIKGILNLYQPPIIFGGDFNLIPESQSMKSLGKDYQDLIDIHKINNTRNLELKSPQTVDYMFASNGFNIKSFKVSNENISDHLPLILET